MFSSLELIIVSCLVISFFISYISIPSILRVAKTKQLYKTPNHRSSHSEEIPTLGGLAIFAGFSLTSLIFINGKLFPEFNYIIAASIIMFFIGMKDDILIIAPFTKMAGQIIAAIIVIIPGGIRITNLHGLYDVHEINYFISVILTLIIILAIINAFNFIDGIDGLCAAIGILATLIFGAWFYLADKPSYSILAFSLIGSMIAFLKFNLFSVKNKLFMGDTGSLILGLVLSVLAIEFNEMNVEVDYNQLMSIRSAPSVTFGILIVPLFDMLRVMFIRLVLKKPVFKADKRHIHHIFLKLGYSHKKIVLILVLANIMFFSLVFWSSQYLSIRRHILVIILMAMIVFYIPGYLADRKNTKKE